MPGIEVNGAGTGMMTAGMNGSMNGLNGTSTVKSKGPAAAKMTHPRLQKVRIRELGQHASSLMTTSYQTRVSSSPMPSLTAVGSRKNQHLTWLVSASEMTKCLE